MSHYFVALPLSTTAKKHLHAMRCAMQEQWIFRKWTHIEDYHLTLFFLGSVTEEQREQVVQRLHQIAVKPKMRPFRLSLDDWGIFGREAQPRILWAGVQGERERLFALQRAIQKAMYEVGFPLEKRPYRPHITVAKRAQSRFSLSQVKQQHPLEKIAWNIQNMILYQSNPSHTPHYREVIRFSF